MRRSGLIVFVGLAACSGSGPEPTDSGVRDLGARTRDAGLVDSGPVDLGEVDAGFDAGADAGPADLGPSFECAGTSRPFEVFNAFWSAFDLHYALFAERLPGGNWDDIGRTACAMVNDNLNDDQLFDILIGMARNFNDGHIVLTSPSGREEDAWVTPYPNQAMMALLEGNVEDNYLDGDLTYAAEDEFAWGRIGDFGYLSITSLDDLSSSGFERDDVDAARNAVARAVASFEETDGMIIDARANEGGWDSVAIEVAFWFAGRRVLAWSERTRDGPRHTDFGPWDDVFVPVAEFVAYQERVILLTSGGSFSAAETMALALKERDRVTIMGERSSGHFSDLVEVPMPHNWQLELSGEQYRAADGNIYETQGVPVDMAVPFDPTALMAGQDVMLEAALQVLMN